MQNLSNPGVSDAETSAASKPSIVFVGLGTMGLPMASNLVRAGFPVTGSDANRRAVDALVAAGGHDGNDTRDAASRADVVITMLPDDRAVNDVLAPPSGLLAVMKRGSLAIEMSTTAPSTKVALAAAAACRSIDFVESPVGKTMEAAIAGTLTLMVGGTPSAIARARPILASMGNELHVCGEVGAASAMKLINNALVACINAASIEALVAGRKAKLGLDTMMGVFRTTMAWNQALAVGLPRKALKRDFRPGFMTRLAHKDVGLALGMAKDLGVPMTQVEAAYGILGRALDAGYGGDDTPGSMLRVSEAQGGVQVGA
jgi:3-hydroxyisobutyrate dehydrogenase-like beta-hydroxyacid dehydrogenase